MVIIFLIRACVFLNKFNLDISPLLKGEVIKIILIIDINKQYDRTILNQYHITKLKRIATQLIKRGMHLNKKYDYELDIKDDLFLYKLEWDNKLVLKAGQSKSEFSSS